MPIYKRHPLNEEVLDSVQDPENPGNDLKQIEDDIAGKNGLEAHSEEIEDAIDGAVKKYSNKPKKNDKKVSESFNYTDNVFENLKFV